MTKKYGRDPDLNILLAAYGLFLYGALAIGSTLIHG